MDLLPIRPVEFDRALNTGQIGWKFTENTLYASLVELGIVPMNSTGIYLNGFTPNSTGQISSSTGHEILVKLGGNSLYASLVELGIIPMNSTGIYLNGFTPNSTGRIRLGIKYWSNWLEIHGEYIVCLPG